MKCLSWFKGVILSCIFLMLMFSPLSAAQQETADTPLGKTFDIIIIQNMDVPPILAADYPDAANECETSALEALKAKNIFQKVEMGTSKSKYDGAVLMIQPTLTSLRIVSGAARFWGGALAGNSDMSVMLKLVDASTGSVLREKSLSTANNPYAAAWTFGSSDKSMPSDMGKMIAEYVSAVSKTQ